LGCFFSAYFLAFSMSLMACLMFFWALSRCPPKGGLTPGFSAASRSASALVKKSTAWSSLGSTAA
jgi:hypothetical protein